LTPTIDLLTKTTAQAQAALYRKDLPDPAQKNDHAQREKPP